MRTPRLRLVLVVLGAVASLAVFSQADAGAVVPSPVWRIESLALPTNFVPEDETHNYGYEVRAVDITGAQLGSGPILLTDTLPAGLGVKNVDLSLVVDNGTGGLPFSGASLCETTTAAETSTVTCKVPAKFEGQELLREALTLTIDVTTPVSLEGDELTNVARIQGGGATLDQTTGENRVSNETAPSGLARLKSELLAPDGTPVTQAGSHPYLFSTSFELNTELSPSGSPIPAHGDLRDVHVALPPGLIGDPTATVTCDPQQFAEIEASGSFVRNKCPAGSVVGTIDSLAEEARADAPIFNLTPPVGLPALLGFQIDGFSFFLKARVGPGPEHPIVADLENLTEIERPIGGRFTLWGVPADASHDRQRTGNCFSLFGVSLGSCAAGIAPKPFLRLPTSCESELSTDLLFNTWDNPGMLLGSASTLPVPTGCSQISFSPSIGVRPQTSVADSPSGIEVDLHVPQSDDPELLASADLRDVHIELPAGLTVNPASASGLLACTTTQIDLEATTAPNCPEASKLGTVEVVTPLLDHPASGAVYLAAQGENPFGSLLAIYLVVDDPRSGVVLKLAGNVTPDPTSGQLTTTFENNPQIPFEDLRVQFFNGPRAALRTPPRCGAYTTTSDLRPWSAPESGPDATPSSTFDVTSGPQGPCPSGALAPELSAGVTYPIAGAYTPFTTRLARTDGSGEIAALSVSPPEGVLARLKGLPYCPEAAIAQAAARGHLGGGALELAQPSCQADSQVGTIDAGVGAGPEPLFVGGKIYLAGPYRGAPLSLVAIIPAVAGPFDLGVVVDRVALQVDPQTTRVTAATDPLPTILSGIPVDLRDIRVRLDRRRFTIAPTSCARKSVNATVFDAAGQGASASVPFRVGACKALGFRPRLSFHLKGGTRRTSHPALTAVLKSRPGDANIARTQVILPAAFFIDPAHISNPCTRVQFATNACPKGSVLGRARAFSPLLDKPLVGNVYFRSNGGERELPDLVADLDGQIHIILVGFIDSVRKRGAATTRLRTTFATVPDAPVSKFTLKLAGGKRGLLQLSRNLCKSDLRIAVKMRAQNGRVQTVAPRAKTGCPTGA